MMPLLPPVVPVPLVQSLLLLQVLRHTQRSHQSKRDQDDQHKLHHPDHHDHYEHSHHYHAPSTTAAVTVAIVVAVATSPLPHRSSTSVHPPTSPPTAQKFLPTTLANVPHRRHRYRPKKLPPPADPSPPRPPPPFNSRYEDAVIAKRLEELADDEVNALLDEIDRDEELGI